MPPQLTVDQGYEIPRAKVRGLIEACWRCYHRERFAQFRLRTHAALLKRALLWPTGWRDCDISSLTCARPRPVSGIGGLTAHLDRTKPASLGWHTDR